MSEEKDPEELLNSLLSQTLKASPFLDLSSGQHAHLYQLFVERDESKLLPSVQELFEQSFLTSGVKLKKVPSVLILQMPRFGRQFKVYDRILPSQILDVTDVIEDGKKIHVQKLHEKPEKLPRIFTCTLRQKVNSCPKSSIFSNFNFGIEIELFMKVTIFGAEIEIEFLE